jgi:hypothetical protein
MAGYVTRSPPVFVCRPAAALLIQTIVAANRETRESSVA